MTKREFITNEKITNIIRDCFGLSFTDLLIMTGIDSISDKEFFNMFCVNNDIRREVKGDIVIDAPPTISLDLVEIVPSPSSRIDIGFVDFKYKNTQIHE